MKKNRIYRFLKYIVLGLLLLFLFHFESLNLGPIKISHLWKGILLIFLILKTLNNKKIKFLIYNNLFWLALLQLLNVELVNNPFNASLLFGTTLILPLLGIYVLQFSSNQLKQGLIFFASFFILAFVPYELGLLESYGDSYELTGYGVEQAGIIGPFQGAHAASAALAGSFLVILYFWFTKSFNRLYLSTLLILGFYFLIFTYVRTGMLMVIIGILPMLIYFAKKESLTRFRLIFIGGLFSVLISGWVLSNETLMNRIIGKRQVSSETESFESLGSGRGQIYIYALEIYIEANFFENLFGLGQTEQKNRMEKKLGSALIPHNGFLLILLNNGLLGLLVFLIFVKKIIKFFKTIKTPDGILIKGLFFAYLIMTFFQNFDLIYIILLFFMSIGYSYKLREERLFNRIISIKSEFSK